LNKILNAKREALPANRREKISVEAYVWCPLLEDHEPPIKQPWFSLHDPQAFLLRTKLERSFSREWIPRDQLGF